MADYLFVYDGERRDFPCRLRIIVVDENPDSIRDISELTGTVLKSEVPEREAQLREEYSAPRFDVSRAYANKWSAIANNYRGLRDH